MKKKMQRLRITLAILALVFAFGSKPSEAQGLTPWQESLAKGADSIPEPTDFVLNLLKQDACELQFGQSAVQTPMKLGQKEFAHGLGAHANSHIRVNSPEPVKTFSAWIGVDQNPQATGASIIFSVVVDEREVYRSNLFRYDSEPQHIEVAIGGAKQFDLVAFDGGDGIGCDHADWADAAIITEKGTIKMLDQMPLKKEVLPSGFPFSFTYGGKPSRELLKAWPCEEKSSELDQDRFKKTLTWKDPETKLKVAWESIYYKDFPAVDWILYFENTGQQDTAILEDIQSLDLNWNHTMPGSIPYRLQKLRGGVPHPTLLQPNTVNLHDGVTETIGSFSGRTSSSNAPFFRLETGEGTFVFTLEWSGTWQGEFSNQEGNLHARAGMQKTHFLLHSGEKVRQPRVLVLNEATVNEAHARFRQLIYKHYAVSRTGKAPLPTLFCNTAFTRGGGWLNECNEQNQISLIKAYAPLGLEAIFTDAGWFTGGWPAGAGNWDPRKDAYPNGMGPVAAAAKENGMIYGLWFEPERVIKGTSLHQNHPDWLLFPDDPNNTTCLANFGMKEVQDYFFNIVKGFMDLPGFRVYRQDFNMDPLPYWHIGDTDPNRQGITEIRYVEGMYAYWDRIRAAWPDCFMDECASGGHRIELGTVMRLDIHQLADYWFDDEANQASVWSISQYLPNNTLSTHINNMDDYSFHSALAASLCLGWIADAPDFDSTRAKALTDRYLQVRHLMVGAWYPLTPYPYEYSGQQTSEAEMWEWDYDKFPADPKLGGMHYPPYHEHLNTSWVASQYHRPELGEGMLLVFRRKDSPYGTLDVRLQGLEPQSMYELKSDRTGKTIQMIGSELMKRLVLDLPEPRTSDLITYKKVENAAATGE